MSSQNRLVLIYCVFLLFFFSEELNDRLWYGRLLKQKFLIGVTLIFFSTHTLQSLVLQKMSSKYEFFFDEFMEMFQISAFEETVNKENLSLIFYGSKLLSKS